MKILLTSAGLSTEEIREKLREIATEGTKVGFIPTARGLRAELHENHVRAIENLKLAGFEQVDIIDISDEDVDLKASLDTVDIVYLAGGNTFYLMHQLRETGVAQWLDDNVGKKVYVGESAGSIVMTPSVAVASIDDGDVNEVGLEDLSGLGFVDFEVSPHTPEDVSVTANKAYADTINTKLYAYDNESALYVDDESIEAITEIGIKEFN